MTGQVIFWLVVIALCAIIELATMGLTTVWFAGGAIVAAIVAFVCPYFWVQALVFIIVGFVLCFFTRPIAVKYFNKDRVQTNAESLVGQRAIVVSEIDNLKGIGEVTVSGLDWSARCVEDGLVIPEKAVVVIRRIEGVKLIVELDDSLKEIMKLEQSDELLNPERIEEQDD